MVVAIESHFRTRPTFGLRVTFLRLRNFHGCIFALHYYLLYVLGSSFILLYNEANGLQSPEFRLGCCMFDQSMHLLLRDAHWHDYVTNKSKLKHKT